MTLHLALGALVVVISCLWYLTYLMYRSEERAHEAMKTHAYNLNKELKRVKEDDDADYVKRP